MKIDKTLRQYLLGGLITVVFCTFFIFSTPLLTSNAPLQFIFVIASIIAIYYLLLQRSAYVALGFLLGFLVPVLFLTIMLIEITVHPME